MSSNFPRPGEWVCFRGNHSLDAHSQAMGQITSPTIAWKHFVGLVETILVVEPADGDTTITVPGENSPAKLAEVEDPRWGIAPPPRQLAAENNQPLARNFYTTYAQVLPGEAGIQKFEFESAFIKPTINGAYDVCVGRCFTWKNGQWVKVWETEPIKVLFQPLPVVGDFDGDGEPEIAILPWYELLILDARTGQVKDRCKFTDGRSYGFFGVYDLDGDGKSEFLIQSDFSKHVEVLGYRDGTLQLLWQREIEPDISDPQIVMRVSPNPVGDINGDGRLEVLLNLYNEAGDGRWHITVHDPRTGVLLADLADQRLQGVDDINGDGKAEILTVRTAGYIVPAFGTISVFGFDGSALIPLWSHDAAAWQMWHPHFAQNVSSTATQGRQTALQRSGPDDSHLLFRQQTHDQSTTQLLSLAIWDGNGLRVTTEVRGDQLEAIALDTEGRLLLRCMTQPEQTAQINVTAGRARLLSSQPMGGESDTVGVVWPVDAPAPTIVVQGHGEELVAFAPPEQGKTVAATRRWSGRGQNVVWPMVAKSAISALMGDLSFPPKQIDMMLTYAGPVLTDLFGDGQRQILYATASPTGCALLMAEDVDGREVWRHEFPEFPGSAPVASNGGAILWLTGHFTDPRRQDVLVTMRRSAMHSEETFLLSGQDGHELWRLKRQLTRHSRAVGGVPFAIGDYDGDGLDDIVSFHPSIFYIIKGSSGENLILMDTIWKQVPVHQVYWGIPITGHFEDKETPTVFLATDRASMTGLVRPDGELVWWDALDKSPKQLPAVGDFDGDGAIEVIGIAYEDGIRCYNAATGVVKWRLSTPSNDIPSGVASADINGDGRDEVIFVIGKTLYCVGVSATGSGGVYLWQVDLPCPAGPPSIAILDGDDRLSILLVGEDGYVYCVQ